MPDRILIKGARLINEGQIEQKDLLIVGDRIERIDSGIQDERATEINAEGLFLMPGIIDDQVHFREPGLTHKAEIYTEAKAAVSGGTTSFMEMPNTKPPAITQAELQKKYDRAQQVSLGNYSFFMGASNENLEEVLKTDPETVCGIKIFMGSSTGKMLVDEPSVLDSIFARSPMLIATHCEDEETIRTNTARAIEKYGEDIPIEMHPDIRSRVACYLSSSFAKELAEKHNTRLHILHLTTADELSLFRNDIPLADKRITSEVCVHHLSFSRPDYAMLGSKIKCNPAIKDPEDREALWKALLDDRLDIIATDHAPHTLKEKQQSYVHSPSGLPLVQHSLYLMLRAWKQGRISLERIIEKMCHAPAICFRIRDRGYLREGYFADLVLVDLEDEIIVRPSNIHYKCGWSPLEGEHLPGKVTHTFINGHPVYQNGKFDESKKGMRLIFDR